MKVAFGFLVGSRLNQEALWQAYFKGADASVIIHPHQGAYRGGQLAERQTVTPTVRTSWRNTINGHYALYEAFLAASDATHLCILSESCIPVRPFEELRMALELEAGHSLMGRLCVPAWFYAGNPRTKRIIGPEMHPSNASHEQWCILAREHVQCLADNKKRILINFANCFADNECFMGTALRFFGHGDELRNHLVTYTDWSSGNNHPMRYMRVTEELLDGLPNECFFMRKLVPNANVNAVLARIGAEPVAPELSASRTGAPGPNRLAVFVHLHYLELWEELFRYLHNVPEGFDLYVNLSEGGGEEREEALRLLAARIAFEVPFAKLITSPNVGRDVGGLFRLFAEIPEGRTYGAWLFLHGKRSPQYKAGHGDEWRGELLDAVLGTPDQAKRCLKEVARNNVGIVGSRKWVARAQTANTGGIEELCKLMNCKNDKREYIGGTIFWADGRLLEAWRTSGLIQADFAADNALTDGTLAHAWERAVSIHARRLGLQTVGMQSTGRHIPPARAVKDFGPAFHRRQPYVIRYDTAAYPFREAAQRALGLPDLTATGIELPLRTRENDTKTELHKRWYAAYPKELAGLYKDFVRRDLLPRWNLKEAVVQRTPSFRAQLKDNVAVGTRHSDGEFGHGPEEVNFWLPLCDTGTTNCVHIETEPGSGVYTPYPVKYGEILVFNGAYLRHGNVPNQAGDRLSMDFRLALPEHFRPTGQMSVNGFERFEEGGYFERMAVAPMPDAAVPTGRPAGLMFGNTTRPEPPPSRPSLMPTCLDCIPDFACNPDTWSFARQMPLVNAWVINLSSRPDKLATATATLERVGIPFRRLEAVDADAMLIASQKPKEVRHLTIGCTLSHRIILQMAVLNGWDSVAIFEDDLVAHPDFFKVAQSFLSELPDDWEFAWLGWTERHNRHRVRGLILNHVVRHDNVMGTHAYAIRGREAIRKVYEASLTADDHWDIVLSKLTLDWPTAYKSRRALFVQDAATSDIHPELADRLTANIQWALTN